MMFVPIWNRDCMNYKQNLKFEKFHLNSWYILAGISSISDIKF